MQYRDGDAMDLRGIAEVYQSGQKIPKKAFINVIKDAYRLLDKNQVWSIIVLIEKMLIASKDGENLTVAFRDYNEDGTRRF